MTTGVTMPALALREFEKDFALPQEALELRCACFSELRRLRQVYGLNAAIDSDIENANRFLWY